MARLVLYVVAQSAGWAAAYPRQMRRCPQVLRTLNRIELSPDLANGARFAGLFLLLYVGRPGTGRREIVQFFRLTPLEVRTRLPQIGASAFNCARGPPVGLLPARVISVRQRTREETAPTGLPRFKSPAGPAGFVKGVAEHSNKRTVHPLLCRDRDVKSRFGALNRGLSESQSGRDRPARFAHCRKVPRNHAPWSSLNTRQQQHARDQAGLVAGGRVRSAGTC